MQTEDEQLILKKAKRAEYDRLYREKNKEKLKNNRIIYIQENKEKLKFSKKLWRKKNIQNIREYNKEYHKLYRINNKEKIKEQHRLYQKNKRQNNLLYKLKSNLSCRMHHGLKAKNYIKSQRTLEILGCDLETIKSHLEKQFTKGMNWNNQGEWHIDHIIPCASAKTEEELIKLFHYTNLQPLWAEDNRNKSDKIIEKQLFLL